ncbi:nicotinate phosphoribosyltransferase [Candidatus Riflebacteria bacterium]
MHLKKLYNPELLCLLTDLYQFTMAYGYWKNNFHEKQSVFHLFFRNNPFAGGFTISCGLEYAIDFLENFNFSQTEVDFLATIEGADKKPLFAKEFLNLLQNMEFSCDIDAVPEGNVVFPHEPLLRIKGPILQCQLLETPLLNFINFQSLIATKAARICMATGGEPVLEFGMRRAQGIDGALAASRAAYIGGCSATSNVLAGKLFGIPLKGTHAHSWVMAFDDELESFKAYARAMPNNCVFLVDTFDTLKGVEKAIEVGDWLKEEGYPFSGIRLDSGDLAYLSIESRKLLDNAGFNDTAIIASNDLDENIIDSLKKQGAKIGVWGVGTKLATSYEQPALGGVYKLSAIKEVDGWDYRVKLSEQLIKVSTPGILAVRRYFDADRAVADLIYNHDFDFNGDIIVVDPLDMTRQKKIAKNAPCLDLLVPIYKAGKRVYETPAIGDIRANTFKSLKAFHSGVKRFVNPHQYPVGLEKSLHELKTELVLKGRGL